MLFTNVLHYSVGYYQGYEGVYLIALAFMLGALMINWNMDEKPLIYRNMITLENLEMAGLR